MTPTGHKHITKNLSDIEYRILILKELGELCDLLSDYAAEKGSLGKVALFKIKAKKFRNMMKK